MHLNSTKVQILNPSPSYAQFLEENLERNTPCLIAPDLISRWPACSLWKESLTSSPNWTYIRDHYGDEVVSVAQCGSRKFSDQERDERPLRDVLDLWASGAGENLYVKDWHLAKSVRERGDPPFYETPDIFRDDWMNSFWEQEGRDDFRFVYMGVAGTFTPLHRDVYTSYSWSTNITGTKLWRIFPPSVSHLLRRNPESTSSETVYDVRDVDCKVFRGFEDACKEMMVIKQDPGWTIFVPSGWYHQVENVTDAISINHNWCNITNLPSMYASLLTAVADVEHALADVHELLRARSGNPQWEREWTEIVQDVLHKDSGWDWMIFWRMILHNAGQQDEASFVHHQSSPPLSHPVSQMQHCVWQTPPPTLRPPLVQTKAVVRRLVDDFSVARESDLKHITGLSDILNTLRDVLSST